MYACIILLLPLCLTLAAISDLSTMTIPNRLSAAVVAAFVVAAAMAGLGWPAVGMSVVAAIVVFAVCFVLFALRVMGGGDAKLLTATALWFGFDQSLVMFLVAVACAGGVLTIIFLLLRTQANSAMAMGLKLPASLSTETKIPYGIAIAIGGLLTLHHAPVIHLLVQASR